MTDDILTLGVLSERLLPDTHCGTLELGGRQFHVIDTRLYREQFIPSPWSE
jgi:hypothetical protein